MKKIIIFASFAPSLLNFRRQLIEAFIGSGAQVIALAPTNTIDSSFQKKFSELLPAVELRGIDLNTYSMNPFKDWLALIKLIRFFKKEAPDMVFSYTIKPVIYGSIAAKFAGVSHVFSMVTGLGSMFIVRNFKDKVLLAGIKTLYRLGLSMNEKVFFQNKDDIGLFEQMKLVNPQKVLLINGSGVDLNYYATADLPKEINFLFIGRLLVDKGITEYIEAARLIKKSYPYIQFNILGGFSKEHPRSYPEKMLHAAIQDKVIIYHSEVEDVRPFIAQSSILVLPSYREGTPRSVLEAMSMGRPIITTDAPGCRETVQPEINGYLVPVKDAEALAHAMEKFIKNPSLIQQMGVNSRELAETKYDVHKVNLSILSAMKLV
ncbi:MAG: hypothetical protein K0S08_1764 [Gammaproteobacteria bacterium]|jgi:glycosyltransferase involved in cell wall biosynthesis|nr:hypothetical protein [Gammaproteobacteria bacterium]